MIIDRTHRRKIYPLLRAEPVTINGSQQAYTTISSGSVDYQQRNYLDFGSAFNVAVEVSSVAPEYFVTVDGMDSYASIRARFYEYNTTTPKDCTFGVVVQIP